MRERETLDKMNNVSFELSKNRNECESDYEKEDGKKGRQTICHKLS